MPTSWNFSFHFVLFCFSGRGQRSGCGMDAHLQRVARPCQAPLPDAAGRTLRGSGEGGGGVLVGKGGLEKQSVKGAHSDWP